MLKVTIALMLLGPLSLLAEMEISNSEDRAIFKAAYSLSSQLLSKKDANYTLGKKLIKFASWMNPQHEEAKKMKIASILGDRMPSHGTATPRELSNMLMKRQQNLANLQQRLLYIVIAKEINPSNKKAADMYKEMSENGYDLNLVTLLSQAPGLKLQEPKKHYTEKKEDSIKVEKKNPKVSLNYHGNKLTAREVDTIMDLVRFEIFEYSEGNILNAINLITHKVYWRGIQTTITGKRISYSKKEVTDNGAVFYLGPLIGPVAKNHYTLKRKTLREIVEHICIKMNLVYDIKDGEIALRDDQLPLFLATPEDGFHSSTIAKDLTDYDLKALKQYRGKVFEGCGIITGIGTGMDSRERYFSLDGGKVRVHFRSSRLNTKVFKRLQKRYKSWIKSEGIEVKKDPSVEGDPVVIAVGGKARKQGAPDGVPKNRKEYYNHLEHLKNENKEIDYLLIAPDLFLKFKGTCTVERDRVIFTDPEYVIVGEEYVIRRKKK